MIKSNSLPKNVDIIAQIADMKEIDYQNILALTALVEILIDKGIVTQQEIADKMSKLNKADEIH